VAGLARHVHRPLLPDLLGHRRRLCVAAVGGREEAVEDESLGFIGRAHAGSVRLGGWAAGFWPWAVGRGPWAVGEGASRRGDGTKDGRTETGVGDEPGEQRRVER
jgi:hypothetical protein